MRTEILRKLLPIPRWNSPILRWWNFDLPWNWWHVWHEMSRVSVCHLQLFRRKRILNEYIECKSNHWLSHIDTRMHDQVNSFQNTDFPTTAWSHIHFNSVGLSICVLFSVIAFLLNCSTAQTHYADFGIQLATVPQS